MGPLVISLAAGVIVLVGGLLVNGCRISKLLGSPGGAADGGGGIIVVVPSLVRDSAIAGTSTMRVTNLAVSNGGTWTATTDDSWIHVTPTSGGSRANVRMSLDPKDLPPGLHHGAVTVQERETDGARATVAVNFLIQQPILKVSPGGFDFRARTSSSVFRDTIYVSNDGDGTLVWTATTEKHSGWFRFESDTAGTAPGFIALRASNEGLGFFGTYKETIIVASPGAKNSPKRIEVTLRRKRGDDDDASIP
ncbi:MAG: BACON domain-containing protein [Gemmatimonadales bacterium]